LEPRNIETLEPIAWRSPSNIALVKYWGKKPVQIPANPSLSMTLSRAYTEMTLEYSRIDQEGQLQLEFLFGGNKNEKFGKKISGYLHSLYAEFPVLKEFRFKISSQNTFPHSTGIASSASSMSALGLCLVDFLFLNGCFSAEKWSFFKEASILSRLASGSACRSVYGGYVIWGHVAQLEGTSDEYAVPVPFQVHPEMNRMKDAILVVSSKEKQVSSRAGHSLMEGHPYAAKRYELAMSNLIEITSALAQGDFEKFADITESEAMVLHALMMTSTPSYFLFEPNTVHLVNRIREFRKETSVPACFTLDAGPNVHLLYPVADELQVKQWINDELMKFCENGMWIDDELGNGPEKIN
jgi:diphosphomevalonate decarboxylase